MGAGREAGTLRISYPLAGAWLCAGRPPNLRETKMATRGKIGDKLKELRKLLLELEDLFDEMDNAENEKVEKLLEAFRAHGETLKMSLQHPGAAQPGQEADIEDEFLSTVKSFMELKRRRLELQEKEKEAEYLSKLRKD